MCSLPMIKTIFLFVFLFLQIERDGGSLEISYGMKVSYGIFALCSFFVLSFRFVNAKLDECRGRYRT